MPTSSDLVTDLPADFEVFGQAVDTALVDLKGGTTNQVLAKNSDTDMDFKWVTDATGMTNPMTTTGDTIYSSSGSTPARLGIGSTGDVLTVAGGVPSWAAPAGGGKNWSLLNAGGTNLTAASTITVSGISGADGILIGISGASTTNAGFSGTFRFNTDSGANYNNFSVESYAPTTYSAGIFTAQPRLNITSVQISSSGNNAGCALTGYLFISGANASGVKTYWGAMGTDQVSGSINGEQRFVGGLYTGSSAISSVSFVSDNGNFDAGKIWVYTTA